MHLTERCFPYPWKFASVIPVFKNCGDRSNPSNYRPISLLPVISKIFEALINDALVNHLESNNLFSDSQYGFRSTRSTADLLTVITDRIYTALNKSGEARAISKVSCKASYFSLVLSCLCCCYCSQKSFLSSVPT